MTPHPATKREVTVKETRREKDFRDIAIDIPE